MHEWIDLGFARGMDARSLGTGIYGLLAARTLGVESDGQITREQAGIYRIVSVDGVALPIHWLLGEILSPLSFFSILHTIRCAHMWEGTEEEREERQRQFAR